jgi:hypothetical protein
MKKINVSHVSNEHSYWLRTMNFYKTEISILRGILTEIAGKNTGADVMKEVEHFENLFMVQVDNIDRLSHDIHVNMSAIAKASMDANAGYIDGALVATHTELGTRYHDVEHVVRNAVDSFRKFAEQWM